MIKKNRVLAGFVLAMLVGGALFGAAAVAEEGVEEAAQQAEAPEDDVALEVVEPAGEEVETSPPAEEPAEADATDDGGDTESGDDGREPRPRPARSGRGGAAAAGASSSAQPEPEGQGQVEVDPESAAGACPGGTALKIDNLRSNGTFGPITISDFTNTSFTWTSTEGVSAVLVKDGGGYKANPGGTSGSASSLGQDISHVIFCLGGEVPDVDGEEPCDADETMPGTQPCEDPPCDADETMPGTQPCEEPAVCDADETMPGTQACVPAVCDADETMPGTQACVPAVCDADETMPGRQDCNEGVAGVESKPQEPEDDDVRGAGLAAEGEPDGGVRAAQQMAAQPMAAQPVAEGAILPFTGGSVAPLLMVALGLVTAGGGAILIRRP